MFEDVCTQYRADDDTTEAIEIVNGYSSCEETVVGGFHLLDGQQSDEELAALAQRLQAKYPKTLFYTSHCTGDNVFEVMKGVMGEQLQSFRCGTIIKWYADNSRFRKDNEWPLGDKRRRLPEQEGKVIPRH